ncbi:MAG: hypothetical protein AAF591_06545 [Verrucomicrobiota bacterium]
MSVAWKGIFANRWFVGGLVLVAGVIYVGFSLKRSAEKNVDASKSDQAAYMTSSRRMVEENYDWMMPRNRMPAYSMWQSLFYEEGMEEEDFFREGKRRNILLSVLVLIVAAGVMRRWLDWHGVLNVTGAAAFSMFVFKAPFFQAEVMYYGLFFLLFVAMVWQLQRPRWWLAIVCGILLGACYLTKASIPPVVVLFLGFSVMGGIVIWWRGERGGGRAFRCVVMALLAVVVFVGTAWPYLANNKRVFDRYFYNVITTYRMWYDTMDEVYAPTGTRAHHDVSQLPDLPPEQLPGMRKYLREHTVGQIVSRELKGLGNIYRESRHSYGWFKYVVLHVLMGVGMLVFGREIRRGLLRDYGVPALFAVVLCVQTVVLCAWYGAMVAGGRFVQPLFLPALFCVNWALCRCAGEAPLARVVGWGSWRASVGAIFRWGVTVLVLLDVGALFLGRAMKYYGGN